MSVRPEDLAATLLRRHRRELAQHETRAAHLKAVLRDEVALLVREGRIRRAWLIGSLAWGAIGLRSDVDVVVEGLAPEQAALLWDRLGERLAAPVDLLRLEDLEPSFRDRVLAEGVRLDVS